MARWSSLRAHYTLDEVKKLRIAVPGTLTTAYLTLKLFAPEIETVTVPFDKIIPAVVAGEFDAGLIIHEGQLTYAATVSRRSSTWVSGGASRPAFRLPLGGNAIRRSLGGDVQLITTNALRDSIQHALDHREARSGIRHAVRARSGPTLANRFVGMYVNERTMNYGEDGREAIRKSARHGL